METATKTVWTIDPTHSEIQFKVKHLVISTVTGHFRTFEGTVETVEDDFETATIKFSADTASVDTNQAQRDEHLRSGDFFESEKFPKMTFESTNVKKISDDTYAVTGNLTIKGVTKPIELKAEFGGSMTDFYGNFKSGFEITGKVNRKEYGLNWSAVTEAGGIVVGDDVKLALNVQIARPA